MVRVPKAVAHFVAILEDKTDNECRNAYFNNTHIFIYTSNDDRIKFGDLNLIAFRYNFQYEIHAYEYIPFQKINSAQHHIRLLIGMTDTA